MLNIAERTRASTATGGMQHSLARLSLSNFRNYDAVTLELPACPLVFVGENGSGKTNLLEAVSYLAPGQGLRRAKLADVSRFDQDQGWAVAAQVCVASGEVDIGTGLRGAKFEGGDVDESVPDKRIVRIDGKPATGPAVLADYARMVWLTPQMDGLFTDASSSRRRFLDRLVLVVDPGHGARVQAYERAMRQRNRLLRDGRPDGTWLSALEARMAETGVAIAAARRALIENLQVAVERNMTPFPIADIAVRGFCEDALEVDPAVEVEAKLQQTFFDNRSLDQAAGRTTSGPHLSDLDVLHRPKQVPAALCSTGEQKALLVAIVLGQARLLAMRHGLLPILLLDEIAAHLDEERRSALFNELSTMGMQAWMTGTDAALFAPLVGEAAFFQVCGGNIMLMTD